MVKKYADGMKKRRWSDNITLHVGMAAWIGKNDQAIKKQTENAEGFTQQRVK